MEITEVKVFPVREEKLKAFVSIVIDHCFMVNDIKIIQGRDGMFISMPSRRKKNGDFKDVAHPLNNETRNRMAQRILDEYERVVNGGEVSSAPKGRVEESNGQPAQEAPKAESEAASEEETKTLEEVAEKHLSESFWTA